VTLLITAVPLINRPRFDLIAIGKIIGMSMSIRIIFILIQIFRRKHMSLISYFTLFTRDEQRFSVGELVDGF